MISNVKSLHINSTECETHAACSTSESTPGVLFAYRLVCTRCELTLTLRRRNTVYCKHGNVAPIKRRSCSNTNKRQKKRKRNRSNISMCLLKRYSMYCRSKVVFFYTTPMHTKYAPTEETIPTDWINVIAFLFQ